MKMASDYDEHWPKVDLDESKCEQGLRWAIFKVESSSSVRL